MRHRRNVSKLGRSSAHREALMASLVCNLIEQKQIRTTLAKAKQARSVAEKMVTLALKGTLAARRVAISRLHQPQLVATLFEEIAPQYAERPGGYTRIVKTVQRTGDGAEMAILEWVGIEAPNRKRKTKKAAKKVE